MQRPQQQGFTYRNDAEYATHAATMQWYGWMLIHHQRNPDGALAVLWQQVAPPPVVSAPPPLSAPAPARPVQMMVREPTKRMEIRTQVKTYDGRATRDRGIRSMARGGWHVTNVAVHLGSRPLGKKILLGYLAKQKEIFTVTFTRTR